jgi:large subunit ribosomal protein L13
LLRGKLKTNYTPHVDCGDNVIIINAEKVILTGKKMTRIRNMSTIRVIPEDSAFTSPKELLAKKPTAVVEKAIKGMLPKNRLGSELFRNLYVYAGPEHPHQAQQPKVINLNSIR